MEAIVEQSQRFLLPLFRLISHECCIKIAQSIRLLYDATSHGLMVI